MIIQRGELHVDPDNWYDKIYAWYIGRHPNEYGYQENLCHYIRVIVIYAPFAWLFVDPIWWKIRPWMLIWAVCLSIFAGAYKIQVAAEVVPNWMLWASVIGMLVGFAAMFVTLEWAFLNWSERDYRRGEVVDGVIKWGSLPIWFPFWATSKVALWAWSIMPEVTRKPAVGATHKVNTFWAFLVSIKAGICPFIYRDKVEHAIQHG